MAMATMGRMWRWFKGPPIPAEKRWSHQTIINILCACGIVFILGGRYLQETHRIGVITTDVKCIEGTVFWLTADRTIELERRGKFFFKSAGFQPFLPDGHIVIKYLAGLPGDRIEVSALGIYINGVKWGDLHAESMKKAGLTVADVEASYTLADDEILMLGDLPRSFDGRYLGPMKVDRLLGTGVRVW